MVQYPLFYSLSYEIMFGFRKFEEKYDEKKKINLNKINYFYMFHQTHFIYFLQLYKD